MAKAGRGLTITQRTNGSWRAQIRLKGYPPDSGDFPSYEEADAWGLRQLAEIQQTGRLTDRRPAEKTTLAMAIERYLNDVVEKRRSESGREADKARLRRFLAAERKLCAHALAHLTPEMFENWRDRRLTESPSRGRPAGRGQYKAEIVPAGRIKKDGTPRKNAAKPKAPPKPLAFVSPSTVKREMTTLKLVLDYAMRRYGLASNPLGNPKLVERPKVDDRRDVRLTTEQWHTLLAECRAARNPWLAVLVEFAWETGARRSSLLKLRWNDIRYARRTAVLRDVKNSRKPNEPIDAEIGLSPRALEILRDLPKSLDGRVFPVTRSAVEQSFKRARQRAGVAHFRLHDIRHELASRLVEADWPMLDVMAQGAWRDPKSVQRYYAVRGTHLADRLAKLKRND